MYTGEHSLCKAGKYVRKSVVYRKIRKPCDRLIALFSAAILDITVKILVPMLGVLTSYPFKLNVIK
jgi:hypothetical protein